MKDETKTTKVKDGDFAALWRDFTAKLPQEGDLVKGKVISVDNGAVRVDINGLVTGVVRGRELFGESRDFADLKVGDEAEATVIEQENENGEMELSFRVAGHQIMWDRLKQWMTDGITVPAKIIDANKGGLMMQVDAMTGFLPVSQLNPEHYPRVPGGDKSQILEYLKQLIGQELQVKIIDVDEKEDKLIVSEKQVWEDDQKAVLDSYKIGTVIEGEVSALTSFGAFVKFGEGLEGLVHISEIVWQRIDHPKDILKVGDKVKAQIIDLNKSKIYLSLKRLVDDPWKIVKDKYKTGQVIEAEVHKVEPFGLMVKLDENIHGLAHISGLSDEMITDVEQLRKKFKIGDKYKFEIISIEPSEHRLGLKLEGVKGKRVEEGKEERVKKSVEEKEAEESKKEKVEKKKKIVK